MYVAQGISEEAELARLCETAYNARAAVPEVGDILSAWQRDAATYRATARAELDVPYLDEAGGGTARTRMDIFWPAGAEPDTCPIVLFIHGGYWQALERKAVSHLAAGANARGLAVAMPSYDLCPDVTLAVIERQIAAACLFLRRTHGRPVTVCGHSAGGHLTAAMLARDFADLDRNAPDGLVPAGLAISGLFDLRDLVHTSINDRLGLDMAEARRLSPLFWPAPAGKRLLACVGEHESEAFHWQSRALAARWGEAGVTTEYRAIAGANHFTVVAGLTEPASELTHAITQLAGG